MATGEQWISKPKAARRLDVSEKTIDRLRNRGQLVALKLSDSNVGRVRISLASLEDYEARQQGLQAEQAPARGNSLPIPALEAIRAAKAAARRAAGRRATPAGEEATA